MLAPARNSTLKSRLDSITQNKNTPARGVLCFGAGNETCAFSGAPRQTAHRAVCFAVKWCGRISRSGKMLAPARSSTLKSRLDSITQNKNTPARGVLCFGAGNETCAFSGAPRQTAHRAVCFAVKWCGRISRSGKMLAPRSQLHPQVSFGFDYAKQKHTRKGVCFVLERETRLAPLAARPRQTAHHAVCFAVKWCGKISRSGKMLAPARSSPPSSLVWIRLRKTKAHPQGGVLCFGAGNETCAFSGAPRQTAHCAVCFAVKWCGKNISVGQNARSRSQLHPQVSFRFGYTQNKNTPARGCALFWSGKRDLNPRHLPWQGNALPLSYSRICRISAC